MSASPEEIRGFFEEAERLAAQARETNAAFAAMRKRALAKQIDWANLKALAVAHDADEHDEKKHDRVSKIVAKAQFANWYADICHIATNMNTPRVARSSSQSPSVPVSSKSPPSARDSDGAAGPANGTKGPAATNSVQGSGEGPPATNATELAAPLAATAGDGGGPMGAVATLDDPYNADVRTTFLSRV